MNEIIERLKAMVFLHLEHFRDDWDIDVKCIEGNAGIPFLHWTREMGTHIQHLFPPTHDVYPKNDQERVRYLFGEVNRVQLASKPLEMASNFNDTGIGGIKVRLTVYFDGKDLKTITPAKAVEITRDYERATHLAFKPRFLRQREDYYAPK